MVWAVKQAFWGFPPFSALIETIALAVHFQDMDMVGETVQQSPGQTFRIGFRKRVLPSVLPVTGGRTLFLNPIRKVSVFRPKTSYVFDKAATVNGGAKLVQWAA